MHYKTKARIVGWIVRVLVWAVCAWAIWYGLHRKH
jgi:hypothetical protein